jgi:2,3-bisphosphoglycerate-independent phosphoglycerate mutase
MRGPGIQAALTDTDPQTTGVHPLPAKAIESSAEETATYVNQFISQAGMVLAHKHPANMILLRGFARLPVMPSFKEMYGLNAAAIALHGMYRGVAKLVGMQVLPVDGVNLEDEFACLEKFWPDFDFFYLHIKKTDTYGELGDFDKKVAAIEEVDALLPRLLALQPDVVIVSGDHSSPAILKSHSWHPVPTMIYSHYVRADGIAEFGETTCKSGGLGLIPATHIMPLALANAFRLAKYGA